MPCDKEGNKTGYERNSMGVKIEIDSQKKKSKFSLMHKGEKVLIGRNIPLI